MSEALKNYLKGQFKSRKAFLNQFDGSETSVAALIQDLADAPPEVNAAVQGIIQRNDGDVDGLVKDMADTVYGSAARPSGIRGKKDIPPEPVAERPGPNSPGDKNTLPDPPKDKQRGKRATAKPKDEAPKGKGNRAPAKAKEKEAPAARKPPAAALNPDTGKMVKTKGVGSETVGAPGAGTADIAAAEPLPPFFDPSMQMDTGPGAAPTFQVDAEREALYRANPFAFMRERTVLPETDMPAMPDATVEGPDGDMLAPAEFNPFTAEIGALMPADDASGMGMIADTGAGAMPTFQGDTTDAGMRQMNPLFGMEAGAYRRPPEFDMPSRIDASGEPPASQPSGSMISRLRDMLRGRPSPAAAPVDAAPTAAAADPTPAPNDPWSRLNDKNYPPLSASDGPPPASPTGPSRFRQAMGVMGSPFTSLNKATAPFTIVPAAGLLDRGVRNAAWMVPAYYAGQRMWDQANQPANTEVDDDFSPEAIEAQRQRAAAAMQGLRGGMPGVPTSPMQ